MVDQPVVLTEPRPPRPAVATASSTVFSSNADFRNRKSGRSAATSVALTGAGRLPLGGDWSVPLDFMAQHISLGEVPDAPVPEAIRTLSLGTGLVFKSSEDLVLMGRLGGTFLRTSGLESKDLGLSAGLLGMWRYSPALTYVFGVMLNPDSDRQALPVVGVNWVINPHLVLSLTPPRPRLTYQPNERWNFHLGANLNGATFRTSATMGTRLGDARYNGALGSYRDVRVGGGFGHAFTPSLHLEAEAGVSVNREINYQRLRESVRFGPAPYLGVGLKVGF